MGGGHTFVHACISEITVEEIDSTKEESLRKKLKGLIGKFKVLKINEKIKDLAEIYIEEGVFPKKYLDDSLYVAAASFYEIPYLVSWNFEHLVKVKTRKSHAFNPVTISLGNSRNLLCQSLKRIYEIGTMNSVKRRPKKIS